MNAHSRSDGHASIPTRMHTCVRLHVHVAVYHEDTHIRIYMRHTCIRTYIMVAGTCTTICLTSYTGYLSWLPLCDLVVLTAPVVYHMVVYHDDTHTYGPKYNHNGIDDAMSCTGLETKTKAECPARPMTRMTTATSAASKVVAMRTGTCRQPRGSRCAVWWS